MFFCCWFYFCLVFHYIVSLCSSLIFRSINIEVVLCQCIYVSVGFGVRNYNIKMISMYIHLFLFINVHQVSTRDIQYGFFSDDTNNIVMYVMTITNLI